MALPGRFVVKHEADASRFAVYAESAGQQANNKPKEALGYLEYAVDAKKIDMYHTFVDPNMRGKGLANLLTDAAFSYARSAHLQVIPSCSYVAKVLELEKDAKALKGEAA